VKMMEDYDLFDRNTQAIIYGFQVRAIQRMLDFDYVCRLLSVHLQWGELEQVLLK